MAAVRRICHFLGVRKFQPAEDTRTMTQARLTISLVVRVISQSKNNLYNVIRLKIIENRYVPKETVMVGIEKQPRWRTIERDEITVNFKRGFK